MGGAPDTGRYFQNAGIAAWIAEGLGFLASWPPILVIIFLCVVVAILTEVVSNFVVVAAFLPAISGLAVTIGMNPMFLMMAVSLSASFAFMLPTGTPPNALVFGSGYIEMKDLMKGGFCGKGAGHRHLPGHHVRRCRAAVAIVLDEYVQYKCLIEKDRRQAVFSSYGL